MREKWNLNANVEDDGFTLKLYYLYAVTCKIAIYSSCSKWKSEGIQVVHLQTLKTMQHERPLIFSVMARGSVSPIKPFPLISVHIKIYAIILDLGVGEGIHP